MSKILCGLALATMLASPAMADSITASCRTDNTALAAETGTIVSTTSTEFVPVPDLRVTIDAQGAVADCIIVNFAGATRATVATDIGLRAYLDGKPLGRPLAIRIANGSRTSFESGSAEFVIPNVTKGTHVVALRWRVSRSGGTAWMRNRSIEVLFKGQ